MDDEELPAVIMSSPVKGKRKARGFGHRMPTAGDIAAARLKRAKALQDLQNKLPLLGDIDAAMSEDIQDLSDSPGSSMSLLVAPRSPIGRNLGMLEPLQHMAGCGIDKAREKFIQKTLCKLRNTGDLELAMDTVVSGLHQLCLTGVAGGGVHPADVQASVLLLSAVHLDMGLRERVPPLLITRALHQILTTTSQEIMDEQWIISTAQQVLHTFPHYLDRYEVSESMIRRRPSGTHSCAGTQLALATLAGTLCAIAGIMWPEPNNDAIPSSIHWIRSVLSRGPLIANLRPARLHAAIRIINRIHGLTQTHQPGSMGRRRDDRKKEDRDKKWIIAFLSSLKCGADDAALDADVFKVKVLCAQSILLWQDEYEEMQSEHNKKK